jgi:hypothetical protein
LKSHTTPRPALACADCGKTPTELGLRFYCEPGQDPDDYVWESEGTLDRATGNFLCDDCYYKHGTPTAGPRNRWTATPVNLSELGL